jgi:hypothetical protein
MAAQVWPQKRQVVGGKVGRTREASRLRMLLFFFAAASAALTLLFVWMGINGALPMSVVGFPSLMMTDEVNLLAIIVNGMITFGLLDAAIGLR